MADRGSATVETALVLPALVLMSVALCGVVSAVTAQIRCVDAARTGARAAARGEADAAVRAAVSAAAPHGAETTIEKSDGYVRVAIASPISRLPLLEKFTVHADAEALDESTADGPLADERSADEPAAAASRS